MRVFLPLFNDIFALKPTNLLFSFSKEPRIISLLNFFTFKLFHFFTFSLLCFSAKISK